MNYFVYYKKKMIDKQMLRTLMIKRIKPAMEIANDDGETYKNVEEKIMIMEEIGKLQDEDRRFIILKTLQGYKSKDIAIYFSMKRLCIVCVTASQPFQRKKAREVIGGFQPT